MSWFKLSNPKSSLLYSILVLSLLAFGFSFGLTTSNTVEAFEKDHDLIPQAVFPADGATLGAIPDSNSGQACQGDSTVFRDVSFNVSGLTGNVATVSVSFSASHTYLQDLEVTLRAPGGAPSHLLFAATGTTDTVPGSCDGSFADLLSTNTYTFSDTATDNWWSSAGGTIMPAGTYRTVVSGIGGAPNPPPTTSIDAAFAGMSSAQANGTWTLRFRDQGQGDTGTVTESNLTITTLGPTAAPVSISGRVFDASGKLGEPYAVVQMMDQNGEIRSTRTNPFGYFKFENIEVGQTLVFNVFSRRYQYDTQIVNLDDSITNLNFLPQTTSSGFSTSRSLQKPNR